MFARAALGSIWIYQTYISPHKGFRCAHSVVHKGTGCSGYAKQSIQTHGLLNAIPLIKQRFKECKVAYLTLQSEQSQPDGPGKKKKKDSCSKQMRDGCCDAVILEGCDHGFSCFGRTTTKATKGCDTDCDICSCG